jgi:isoleucyl-tRNA synthetase
LFQIITHYLFLLAPIIPHTCEEVYSFLNISLKQKSIFIHNHTFELELPNTDINYEKWEQFFKIKTLSYAKLEELRRNKIITKNTQAIVLISFNNSFGWTAEELKYLLNVAKVEISQNDNSVEFEIKVDNANYERCERCWNYFPSGSLNEEKLCTRCQDVLKTNN